MPLAFSIKNSYNWKYCALVAYIVFEGPEEERNMDTLGDERTARFFLISDTDTTYNFIVALAFPQMFNLLCERADSRYGGCPRSSRQSMT